MQFSIKSNRFRPTHWCDQGRKEKKQSNWSQNGNQSGNRYLQI